jgi:hypothetical protein
MEAFYALRRVREMEGYNLFLRGMETTINDSARMIIHHVNNHKRLLKEEKHGAAHK